MDPCKNSIQHLINQSDQELRRLRYSDKSISTCHKIWNKFKIYSLEQDLEYYDHEVARVFLKEKYNYPDLSVDKHKPWVNEAASAIRRLGDMDLHGRFLGRFKKSVVPVPAGFIESYDAYIEYCIKRNNKPSTVKRNKILIKSFFEFLISTGVDEPLEITSRALSEYMTTLLRFSKKTVQRELGAIKAYLKSTYFSGLITQDFSDSMPKLKFARIEKPVMVWTEEDVANLLNAVDRGNPYGKRDYAILLLVTQLGIRDSDIKNLKLTDICWAKNLIEFTQLKTTQKITLPLLPEIGWAIIDYLKSGRPTTDSPYVFVIQKAPYSQVQKVGNIVARYQRQSGVKVESGNQHGIHSLRHTLASRLLEQHVALELISGILGHIDVNSAKAYLHTDIDGLRQCALSLDSEVDYE